MSTYTCIMAELIEKGVLREQFAAVLEQQSPELFQRMRSESTAHLEFTVLAQVGAEAAQELVDAAVNSARAAGCTWEQIGSTLGTSRQAAQQRFGVPSPPRDVAPHQMVLRRVTAFNEMDVLDRAGRYGWHSVDYGPTFHIVERSEQQWEHTRTRWSQGPDGDGWQPVGRGWGWWRYWKRPRGLPATTDSPSAERLVRG